jgi:diguanylate cyclase (GGDEF)-like protein
VRDTDLVARLGGDEFAVLAVETADRSSARLARRIRRSLADADVEASVGAASARADRSLPEALEAADHAMYREKARRDRARGAAREDGDDEPVPPSAISPSVAPTC